MLSFFGCGILLVYSLCKLAALDDYDPLQPVTVMFMYWIVCDLLQALATMANLRWALQGAAMKGMYCRVQGTTLLSSPVSAIADTKLGPQLHSA